MREAPVCLTCKREKDESPLTYRETVDYVRGMILEGICRGRSVLEIFEVAVLEGFPIDDDGGIRAYLRQRDQEQIDFYKSPSHKYAVCSRCHVVTDKDKVLCGGCNDATIRWSDGVPVTDGTPDWVKRIRA